MPNPTRRNKRGGSQIAVPDRRVGKTQTHSVKDLLARTTPTLTRLSDQAARQAFWQDWLRTHLPVEIAEKLSGVVEREGTLVIFAESAAWSARLRYAVQDLEEKINAAQPEINEVKVRVLPRGAPLPT